MSDDADGEDGFQIEKVWRRRLMDIGAIDRVLAAAGLPYAASNGERHVARVMVVLIADLALISSNLGRPATKKEIARLWAAFDELQQSISAIMDTRDRLPDWAPVFTLLDWLKSLPQRDHANIDQQVKFTLPLLLSFYEGIFGRPAGKQPGGPAADFILTFNKELAEMLRQSVSINGLGERVPSLVWPEPSAETVAQQIRKHADEAAAKPIGPRLHAKFLAQLAAVQEQTYH